MTKRVWPVPPDGAIHLIGDSHFGSAETNTNRKNLWSADARRVSKSLPNAIVHVSVGDVADHGMDSESTEAVNFFNTLFGSGTWISAVGNHDLYGALGGPQRNPDVAAQALGMSFANFIYDLPWARFIVIAPNGQEDDGFTPLPFTSTRLDWINTQLVGASGKPCFIVCHWSLYDTVEAFGGTTGSYDAGYYALVDSEIRSLLADNVNAKGWLSGHTHSPLGAPGLVKSVDLGSHRLVAINASAPTYTGGGGNFSSQLATMYLTVTSGKVAVRFRDHGAGIWCPAGPERVYNWTASL
jgi:hypothetical protein